MIHHDTRAINRTLAGLRNKTPFIFQQGGSSSGKTFGVLYALLSYLLYDKKDERQLWSVVSETLPHLKKGAMKDFQTILNETGLYRKIKENRTDHQFTLPTGSVIEFFSADDETKVRGPRRDGLFVNEANSISWEIFYQMNLRTKEGVILDWNPSGEFWFHDLLLPTLKKEEYLFTITTYKDNPANTDKVIREIERLAQIDPVLYRIYGEGKTGQVQGLIFPNVAYTTTWPENLKKHGYGLDFGFVNDPTVLVEAGQLGMEVFGREVFYQTGLTNDDICGMLERSGVKKTDEIWADAAEPKSIEEIKRKGWNIKPAVKGADSVVYGIDTLKKYDLCISADSTNARKEQRNYKWKDKDGKPLNIPVDAFNHFFDAWRYWGVMNLQTENKRRGVKISPRNDYALN